jgi:molybdenum cofactor biosynthesis protein B
MEKKLDGFGEIFRYLSYLDIGSAALMSRAVAGAARGKILISLPGSRAAVTLAMEKLILPELRHMVSQLQGK